MVPTRQMWQPFSASSATFLIHLVCIVSNDDLPEATSAAEVVVSGADRREKQMMPAAHGRSPVREIKADDGGAGAAAVEARERVEPLLARRVLRGAGARRAV